jgi:hypothetical protein
MTDIESRLEQTLKSVRDEHTQSIAAELPAARQRVMHRVRRHQFRFVITSTAATAAALVALLFVVQANPFVNDAGPLPPAGKTPSVVAVHDLGDRIPTAISASTAGAWVTAFQEGALDGPAYLMKVEPPGEISDVTGGSTFSGGWTSVASTGETTYFVDQGEINSVGPAGGMVNKSLEEMDVSPDLLAASGNTLWFSGNGSVRAASADSLEKMPGGGDLHGPIRQLVARPEGAWAIVEKGDQSRLVFVSDTEPDLVTELDPGSSIAVSDLSTGTRTVWIASGDTLTRLDVEGGDCPDLATCAPSYFDGPVVAAPAHEIPLPGAAVAVTEGEGYVWVVASTPDGNQLLKIDRSTNEFVGDPVDVGSRQTGLVPQEHVAVGAGYVWVTNSQGHELYQIDPAGRPSPAPVETLSDEETERDPSFQPDRDSKCEDIPFAPTVSPGPLGLGGGGSVGIPLAEQTNPDAPVIHYGGPGSFVDVVVGESGYAAGSNESIEVLGEPAQFGVIEDGYLTRLEVGNCTYTLLQYMSEEDAKAFSRGLVRAGDPRASDTFAMFPEHQTAPASERCARAGSVTTHPAEREAGIEIGNRFASEVLGWEAPITGFDGSEIGAEPGTLASATMLLKNLGHQNEVLLQMRQVASLCWVVTSLAPVDQHPSTPTGISVSKRGDRLRVAVSLDRNGILGSVETARIQVPGNEEGEVGEDLMEVVPGQKDISIDLGLDSKAPSYFLILFEDAGGNVLNALGMALPSGDFVAG